MLGCGSRIAENCTYFQSSTTPASGTCGVTICKCSTDICQVISIFIWSQRFNFHWENNFIKNTNISVTICFFVFQQVKCFPMWLPTSVQRQKRYVRNPNLFKFCCNAHFLPFVIYVFWIKSVDEIKVENWLSNLREHNQMFSIFFSFDWISAHLQLPAPILSQWLHFLI